MPLEMTPEPLVDPQLGLGEDIQQVLSLLSHVRVNAECYLLKTWAWYNYRRKGFSLSCFRLPEVGQSKGQTFVICCANNSNSDDIVVLEWLTDKQHHHKPPTDDDVPDEVWDRMATFALPEEAADHIVARLRDWMPDAFQG